MARFFVSASSIQGNTIIITGPDVKHIGRVLRLQPGDRLEVVAGECEYAAVISEITAKAVICDVTGEKKTACESPVEIVLFQGMPKGEKMEWIIQKSTELGVTAIVPVLCDRTIVRLDSRKAAEKAARWRRVAEEAAKQSRRGTVPAVREPVSFDLALELAAGDFLTVIPWEQEMAQNLRPVLASGPRPARVAVFVGPEGGFSAAEVEQARARGVTPVSLGPRILRTETAGIVMVAVVQYELGDLGGALSSQRE